MTTQQQPQDPITPDEIGAEWGVKFGLLIFEKIALQKQVERLTTITNEYAERIRELEAEMAEMAKLLEASEGPIGNAERPNVGAFGDSGK